MYTAIVRKQKKQVFFLIAILSASITMFFLNPEISKRSNRLLSNIENVYFENKYLNESTGIRFKLWNLSFEVSKESFVFGHGTGSVNTILNERCLQFYNFSTCEGLRNKNSHNDYLNFLISNGIIFLVLFLVALYFGIRAAIRGKDIFFVLFMLFMALNFFFESILQRERGVVFFTLFVVLLTISQKDKESA